MCLILLLGYLRASTRFVRGPAKLCFERLLLSSYRETAAQLLS
jgi:hypothetical protein